MTGENLIFEKKVNEMEWTIWEVYKFELMKWNGQFGKFCFSDYPGVLATARINYLLELEDMGTLQMS